MLTYQNKYGKVILEIVGPYQDIRTMRVKDQCPSSYFTLNEAEQIALITGNKNLQIAFEFPYHKNACVFHHISSGLAALCKVVSIEFNNNINAPNELERLNSIAGRLGRY